MYQRKSRRCQSAAVLLSAVLSLAVVACGSDDDTAGDSTAGATSPTTAAGATSPTTAAGATSPTTAAGAQTTTESASGGPSTNVGEPLRGGILRQAAGFDTTSMDPAICGSSDPRGLVYCAPIFGTLLRLDSETGEYVPNMAESFESKDGQSWTLKLRPNVNFTDGEPFNADAVIFNWERVKDPATLSSAARATQGMTWTKVDDLTVQIDLDEPNYQLASRLAFDLALIGSPKAIEAAGEDVATKPVGAGPFMLKAWTRGTKAEYTANPDYWDEGKPYLDGLELAVVATDDQRLNAFKADQIDTNISFSLKDANKMEDEGYPITMAQLRGGGGLGFNMSDPEVSDEGLRMALSHALNPQPIMDGAFPGEPPVDALLRPDDPYRDDSKGLLPGYDLEQAQELFDDYLDRTGKDSLTLTMTSYSGVPSSERATAIMQQQLEQIEGLTVKLETLDLPTWGQRINAGEFQIALAIHLYVDHDRMLEAYLTDSPTNPYHYSNPVVDQTFAEIRATNDPDKLAELYGTAFGEIAQDPPNRLVRWYGCYLWSHDYVKGIVTSPFSSGLFAFYEGAWLDK
jgi:peptide/nickel transport system substrate-binding protein